MRPLDDKVLADLGWPAVAAGWAERCATARGAAAVAPSRRASLTSSTRARAAARGEPLVDLAHVYLPILEAFDEAGRLVDHASDALGPLRRALASIKQALERRMDALLQDDHFTPYLQDGFYTQRQERYVLPIRTDGKGFVHGIVHGTSQSGQTLFIEPEEIVELNNRKTLAEGEVADEERRIMALFSGWIAEEADGFDASLAAAEGLDVIAAAARLADDLVAAAPIIDDAPRLALLHARHPLMLLAGRRSRRRRRRSNVGGPRSAPAASMSISTPAPAWSVCGSSTTSARCRRPTSAARSMTWCSAYWRRSCRCRASRSASAPPGTCAPTYARAPRW